MTGQTLLQLFLYLNVFLVGAAVAIGLQHAYAHFRPPHPHPDADKPHPPATTAPGGHLPPAVKERILQTSQANFQAVLDRSAADLQHDLRATSAELNKLLDKLGSQIVNSEMVRFRSQLDQLREQAETAIGGAQAGISQHQAELKAKLEAEEANLRAKLAEELAAEKQALVGQMAAEQQRLVQQIDTKLADAVASFLMETLQHNVDLGAQSQYLTAMLEEHKADFKRELES